MSILESRFQRDLISELEELFPGIVVLKNDPNYIRGFPDLLLLIGPFWAALETKKANTAEKQKLQPYYVELLNKMSYCAFINPQNKDQIIYEIQQALRSSGTARLPISK